jgi:hypothetical protein
VLMGAQLQSTTCMVGRCGCWPRPRGQWQAADCDEDVWFGTDISPHGEVTVSLEALCQGCFIQSTASWRVVEYGACTLTFTGLSTIQDKGRTRRRRMGQEWPFEGRIRGHCELTCSSRWPPWRRCFYVRQDGDDALVLIALVFIGAVEAAALMESIMV